MRDHGKEGAVSFFNVLGDASDEIAESIVFSQYAVELRRLFEVVSTWKVDRRRRLAKGTPCRVCQGSGDFPNSI